MGEGSVPAILKGPIPIFYPVFYPNAVVSGDPAAAPGATSGTLAVPASSATGTGDGSRRGA